MSEQQPPQKRSLSEISHLFLSSVRDRHTNGAPRPQRTPPGQPAQPSAPSPAPASNPAPKGDMSIDLTPEEFAQVFGEPETSAPESSTNAPAPAVPRPAPPVTAVIGAHLNGRQFDCVKEYARHLAAQGSRVGLIELDASEFRLMCFEPAGPTDPRAGNPDRRASECFDSREMAEAIEELGWDVDRWLLLVPSPRVPEAKALLRQVDHWALLCTCDHDGVVSSYRTLKGLAEGHRPRLTLALLDATTEADMVRVFRKLSGVCQQFLDWTLEPEPAVRRTSAVAEHLVLFYRPTRDKAQIASAPQWGVASEFLKKARHAIHAEQTDGCVGEDALPGMLPADSVVEGSEYEAPTRRFVGEVIVPVAPHLNEETPEPNVVKPVVNQSNEPLRSEADQTKSSTPANATSASTPACMIDHTPAQPSGPAFLVPVSIAIDEVLDVADGGQTPDSILAAVLRRTDGNFIECPVRAPMCGDARLTVGRDRSVTLFAVARQGLGELRGIALAYRWLSENRALIAMAVPQLSIAPEQPARLRLLVDQSDWNAEALQPLMQSDTVTVQPYRKLRWGGKTGLLLAA